MRAETSAASTVAALSVAVAAAGHLVVSGASMPAASFAPLAALAGACFLLGSHLNGRPRLSVAVLAGVQLVVHLALGATPDHETTTAAAAQRPIGRSHHQHLHGAAAGGAGQNVLADALVMTATHLAVLLAAVVLLARARSWIMRIRRIAGRFLFQVPAVPVAPATAARLLTDVPGEGPSLQRWRPANVSRRGPPSRAAVTGWS